MITDCAICGHGLADHDLQADEGDPRCLMPCPDDPTEGDHGKVRGDFGVAEEDGICGCPGYQTPQLFSYEQAVELLKLVGAKAPTRRPEPDGVAR